LRQGIVAKPKRVGRHKYTMPGPDVQLDNDMSSTIRELMPEGNLVRDQFDSIFRRGKLDLFNRGPTKPKSSLPRYRYITRKSAEELKKVGKIESDNENNDWDEEEM